MSDPPLEASNSAHARQLGGDDAPLITASRIIPGPGLWGIVLCGIFFLSGAAALLFETLWFRQAGLMLGSTVWTGALVTASFMAGLALGSGLAARFGARIASPLLAYAALEVVGGAAGVGLVLVFPHLTATIAPLLQPAFANVAVMNAARVLVAGLLLVVPATAMGATLPLLVRVLSRRHGSFGQALGQLYGWNTCGAMAGAVVGEAALVGALGVRGTAWTAATLNLAAAAGAALVSWRLGPLAPAPAPETRPSNWPERRGRTSCVLIAAFLAGGLLLALETIWFRFLLLFVSSTSATFAVMLAVVLLGIGAGGLAASVWLKRRADAHRFAVFVALLGGISVELPYATFQAAIAPHGTALVSNEIDVFVLSLRLMLPACLASGVLFALVGRALQVTIPDETAAAGWLTLSNTAGATIGALCSGFLLLPRLGMEGSFSGLTCGYGAVAACLALSRPERGRHRLALGAAGVLFLLLVALFPFGLMTSRYVKIVFNRWSSDGARLMAVREGLTETVVLLRRDLWGEPLEHRLVTNGIGMSGTMPSARRYMGLFVWWPVAVHPSPRRALLISYGLGTTARALTDTAALESIDIVDISQEVLDVSRLVFPAPAPDPLADPRTNVHIEDGRFYLLVTPHKYDIITAEPPPPKAAGIVNLYSREYFSLMKERLAAGGIATYWLPVYQLSADETRSVVSAFCQVFDDCSLWTGWGSEWMLVGTQAARGPVSPEVFSRQWSDPAAGPALRDAGLETPEQLGALFLADASTLRGWAGTTPPLEDDHPYRLSPRVPASPRDPLYFGLMETNGAKTRFERSELVGRLWPPELRARSLAWFETQAVLNQHFWSTYHLGPRTGVAELETVLTRTPLRTAVLWLMGSSPEEQRIAVHAAARGVSEPMLDEVLGIGAMADRDYRSAAQRFARAEPHALQVDRLRCWRVLALGLAGDTSGAAALLEQAGPRMQHSAEPDAQWEWLANRFGLQQPLETKPR